MKNRSSFDATLFEDTTTEFVLTPLPATWLMDDTSPLEKHQDAARMTESSLPSPEEPSASPPSATDEALAKKEIRRLRDRIRRQKTKLRRRCEREALEREIEKLSKQAAELKRAKASSSPQTRALLNDRRLLREETKKRTAIINDYRDALGERLHLAGVDGSASQTSKNQQCSGSVLFQQFTQELSTVYAQTDNILEPIVGDEPSSMFKTTREMEGATEYFHTRARQLLPFEYAQTCKHLWRLVALEYRQEDRRFCSNVQDSNTVASSFRFVGAAPLLAHFVVRRYQESGRTVIVWRGLMEGEGSFNGMHSDETGWCVVRPSTMDSCAIVETCTRVVPIFLDTARASKSLEDQFTGVVLKSAEADAAHAITKLKRLLLDDALDAIDI